MGDTLLMQQIAAAFVTPVLPADDDLRWLQRHGLVAPEKTLEQFCNEVEIGRLLNDNGDSDGDVAQAKSP